MQARVVPASFICTVQLSDLLLLINKISPILAACLFPIVFEANMYCPVVTEMVMVEEVGAGEGMVVAEVTVVAGATVVVAATVVMTEEVEEVVVDMTVVAIAMHQSKLFLVYSLGSAVLSA